MIFVMTLTVMMLMMIYASERDLLLSSSSSSSPLTTTFRDVIDNLCTYGDLNYTLTLLHNMTMITAEVSHSIAALELILHGDIESAVVYHKKAKEIDKTILPPLAKLHLG
jgi:hypothetical protein